MLFSPWFIVALVLFGALIIFFVTLSLARTLEGYPSFLIQNCERDIDGGPRPLRIRSELGSGDGPEWYGTGARLRHLGRRPSRPGYSPGGRARLRRCGIPVRGAPPGTRFQRFSGSAG
jgi:hypothetical protein